MSSVAFKLVWSVLLKLYMSQTPIEILVAALRIVQVRYFADSSNRYGYKISAHVAPSVKYRTYHVLVEVSLRVCPKSEYDSSSISKRHSFNL